MFSRPTPASASNMDGSKATTSADLRSATAFSVLVAILFTSLNDCTLTNISPKQFHWELITFFNPFFYKSTECRRFDFFRLLDNIPIFFSKFFEVFGFLVFASTKSTSYGIFDDVIVPVLSEPLVCGGSVIYENACPVG